MSGGRFSRCDIHGSTNKILDTMTISQLIATNAASLRHKDVQAGVVPDEGCSGIGEHGGSRGEKKA